MCTFEYVVLLQILSAEDGSQTYKCGCSVNGAGCRDISLLAHCKSPSQSNQETPCPEVSHNSSSTFVESRGAMTLLVKDTNRANKAFR